MDAVDRRGLPSPGEGDALALTFAQAIDDDQWARRKANSAAG